MKKDSSWNQPRLRHLLYAVAVIVIFTVLFIKVSYFMRPIGPDRANLVGFYAEEQHSLDVVYIGGSACYVFFSPLQAWNEQGFTSCNFAANTLPPQMIRYCVREVLKTQAPELFVIDLRPFQYGEEVQENGTLKMYTELGLRNFSDNFKYSWNRFDMIRNCVPADMGRFDYYVDLNKYHLLLENFAHIENWRYASNEYPSQWKGFDPIASYQPLQWQDVSGVTEKQPLSDTLDTLLSELLEECATQDLKVLFVVHPYASTEEDKRKYNAMQEKITAAGFDFLDSNDYFAEMQLDPDTDYYNQNHTNVYGAEKYTTFLAQYLRTHYPLPDHRQDSAYATWNDGYTSLAIYQEQLKREVDTLRSEYFSASA